VQVYEPSGRTDSDAGTIHVTDPDSQLLEQSKEDRALPHWAAVALDKLTRSDDPGDRAGHSVSDSVLTSLTPSSLPGWAIRALADKSASLTSAILEDAVESQEDSSDNLANKTLKPGTRAVWGSPEPPIVKLSVHDSSVALGSVEVAESNSAESMSVYFDSKEPDEVTDQPDIQVSQSVTSLVSPPKASVKFVEKRTSLRDVDSKLIDSSPLSATDASSDLVDTVVEDKLGSEQVLLSSDAERLRQLAAYRFVSQESTEREEHRHTRTIDNQYVSKETVADDERRYIKLVPNQFVVFETTQVDDRTHLRMSATAGATTESEEVLERASVKPVEGQHISAETCSENAVRPCIRMHAERCATQETGTSLLVCVESYVMNVYV